MVDTNNYIIPVELKTKEMNGGTGLKNKIRITWIYSDAVVFKWDFGFRSKKKAIIQTLFIGRN